MSRRGLLGLLGLGALLLLLLFAAFPRSAPEAPPAAAEPARRELDEAAEEVRAVGTVIRRLERKIADQDARTRELRDGMAQFRHRLEQFEQRDRRTIPAAAPPAAAAAAAPDAGEAAFDLDTLVNPPARAAAGAPAAASLDRALHWIEPLWPDGDAAVPAAAPAAAAGAAAGPAPRFVIPPSVLSGRSLTALVGRVPRGGAVQDPWPFLAVSGRDNLSANGARLPELQGVLWRGVVHGDATLECASASIRSMTYVFPDGVFHAATAPGGEGGFGYLADRAGNPCLAGTLHSTAAEDLHRSLLAGMVAGAGGAFAQEQLATRATAAGETTRVEGDAFKFLLGQTVQGAAGSYAELLAQASDKWEAVVVPAGQELDLHITAAIPVVHDPARRVRAVPAAAPAGGGLD